MSGIAPLLRLLSTVVVAALIIMSKAPIQAQEKGSVMVLPFTVSTSFTNKDNWSTIAYYSGRELTKQLKDAGYPVHENSAKLNALQITDLRTMTNAENAAKFAQRNGVNYLIRAVILPPRSQKKDFSTLRFYVPIEVQIIDGRTGKPIVTIEVSNAFHSVNYLKYGFLDKLLSTDSNKQNTDDTKIQEEYAKFLVNADPESLFTKALNQSIKALVQKELASKYPKESWKQIPPTEYNPTLTFKVAAKTPEEAKKKAVEAGVSKFLSKSISPEDRTRAIEAYVNNAEKYTTQVNAMPNTEMYEVGVNIGSDRDNTLSLTRGMIDKGFLNMPTVAILSDDATTQNTLQSHFTNAGFKVKDDQRLAKLRDREYVQQMLDGKVDPALLIPLKEDLGIDLLVVGEALSERVRSSSEIIIVRSRLRVKVMLPDTADILATQQDVDTGSDITEMIAKEQACKSTVNTVCPQLLQTVFDNIEKVSGDPNKPRLITIELSQWADLSDANDFTEILEGIEGVLKLGESRFESRVLTIPVSVSPTLTHQKLASTIQKHPKLLKFGIKFETASRALLKGKVDPASVTPPRPETTENISKVPEVTEPKSKPSVQPGKKPITTPKVNTKPSTGKKKK